MDHITNIAHGESMTNGRQRHWAKATCTCGWEGIEVGTDKPRGWSEFLGCTVKAWAFTSAMQHRAANGYVDHPNTEG